MKLVIANVCGAANKGDAALLEALVAFLEENGISKNDMTGIALRPDMQEIHMPDLTWYERPLTSHAENMLKRRTANLLLWILFLTYYLFPLKFWLIRLFPKSQQQAIHALRSADVVVSCPGGYLEDSNFSYVTNCIQLLLASRKGSKVVLAPQSIGPVRGGLGKWLIGKVVKQAALVYARDEDSIECIKDINNGQCPSHVLRAGDMALWHIRDSNAPQPVCPIPDVKPVIGLSIIDWNFPSSSNPQALKKRYLNELAIIVKRVAAVGGVCVCVNQVSWDLHIASQLKELIPPNSLIIDEGEHTASSLRKMISGFSSFVGSRLHSCIFALLEDIPVIALAYLPKTVGIFGDLGLLSQVRYIETFSGEEVADQVLSSFQNEGFAEAAENYRSRNNLSEFSKILTTYTKA